MSVLYINARCKQILCILLNRQHRTTMEQLAQELKISRRSAYYDVSKINVWLEQAGIPPLETERGHGLFVSPEYRSCIEQLLKEPAEDEVYIYSPEERVRLIILYIMDSPKSVFVEQLMEHCEVSRNTIFNDLKEATSQLQKYDLTLFYSNRTGYAVQGDPIRCRALFLFYFREMLPLYRDGVLDIFDRELIESNCVVLKRIESELGVTYVDGALQALGALLPILFHQQEDFDFPKENREEWKKTQEYQKVRTYFPQLCEGESLYLTLHLLGSQLTTTHEPMESVCHQEIMDLVRALVSEFERVACIVFEDRKAIEQALFFHLKTSLYRYRYGIQIGSMFYDAVKDQYPELFALTKTAVRRLERSIESPIPDDEVACIALHFGAVLRVEEPQYDHLRILIVCVSGVSTGNMLKHEVRKLLPYAEIVGVSSAVDTINAQKICNLIISTIKINSIVPVITVNPILTEFDRHAILSHRLVAPKTLTIQRDRIFDAVKKYVDPKHYEALQADLTACLKGENSPLIAEAKASTGLLSILDVSRIQVHEKAASWREVIRIAGKPLLDNGSIRKEYLDTIISQLSYYGPYMFLTNDVILAHAKPEDGVNRLDISLSVFHEPVTFSALRHAKLVFILAAEDQEKHLKILQDILLLVGNDNSISRLACAKTSSEVLSDIGCLLAQSEEENIE